jgi:diketogulonate reductase-like aldo/keto reductase
MEFRQLGYSGLLIPVLSFGGARNEEQLRQNLAAVGWNLTKEQIAKLDAASDVTPIYPYWQQRQFPDRNPLPTTKR